MYYFGEPWPSGICDEGAQVPTPVGAPCLMCEEAIRTDDRGTLCGTAGGGTLRMAPIHRECSLQDALGSLAHIDGICSCKGEKSGPNVLSRREEALIVWGYWTDEEMRALRDRFIKLAATWSTETRHLSSASAISAHPAFGLLVAMGPQVVPFALQRLAIAPATDWFLLLRELVTVDPASGSTAVEEAARLWVDWGRREGLLGIPS